eukprot:SAG31_NODE_3794_length_3876_cov_2.497485_2_plen_160_part_00
MWIAVWIVLLVVVAASIFGCFYKIEDDLTAFNIGMMLLKMQLRKRRAATAKEVSHTTHSCAGIWKRLHVNAVAHSVHLAQVKCLMLGIDGAGKTALVHRWLSGTRRTKPPVPTTGFNIQVIKYDTFVWPILLHGELLCFTYFSLLCLLCFTYFAYFASW